jgi:beta-lactamase class A
MLAILEAQEFNDGIPAGLPPGTRVAHKTGEITATFHDAALIWGGEAEGRRGGEFPPYALVILTRGYADREAAMAVMREIAALVHDAVRRERERGREEDRKRGREIARHAFSLPLVLSILSRVTRAPAAGTSP